MNRIIGTLLSAIVAVAIFAAVAFNVMPAITSLPVDDDVTRTSYESSNNDATEDGSTDFRPSSSINDLFFSGEHVADETVDRPQFRAPVTKHNKPEEVSSRRFNQLNRRGLVLVKFGADWCGPCRRMKPELEELAAANTSMRVLEVDVDKEERLAEKYDVGSIPHIVLLQNGKEVESWTGFKSASTLQRTINRVQPPLSKGSVQANPFASE